MIKTVLAACALLCALTIAADARPRHKASGLHPECNVTMPCVAPSVSTPEQVRITRGKYIARQVGFGGPNVKRPVAKTARKSAQVAREQLQPVPAYGAPSPSIGYTIAKPLRFIAGRLICAVNVNAALAERGIKGTGSALALSFDAWGRPSAPVAGAVAVSNRRGRGKGHVAIVSRVEGSRVWVWNATGGRNGWREVEYTNRRARYRVASQ